MLIPVIFGKYLFGTKTFGVFEETAIEVSPDLSGSTIARYLDDLSGSTIAPSLDLSGSIITKG